jgi:Domain of unknown function (DUF4105)
MIQISRLIWFAFLTLVLTLASIWAAAALFFDFRIAGLRVPLSVIYACLIAGFLFFFKGWKRIGAIAGAFAIVLLWWLSLKPSNNEDWQPDVAQTPWGEIQGDLVTIHNVRNCDYRNETDYTPHWETRTYNLSKLREVDLFFTHWGSPYIAHPILSFRFDDELPVAFSIEVRKTTGQSYSAVRGFFRQFTLIYVMADERDVIRLRTNYRKDEEVVIYHIRGTAERARAMFMDYINKANKLRDHPEWYNAATNNCTTGIRVHAVATAAGAAAPWDWRMLLNGTADQMIYERGDVVGDSIPFAEFQKLAHINDAARAANKDPQFSERIRVGRPGF